LLSDQQPQTQQKAIDRQDRRRGGASALEHATGDLDIPQVVGANRS